MSKRILCCAVLVLAAVTGCKSSAETTAAPATTTTAAPTNAAPAQATSIQAAGTAPDPCTLVTPADVAEVLGKQVAAPHSLAVGLYRQCAYTGGLIVEVRTIDRAAFDKSAPMNPGNPQPLSGVGDAAYVSSEGILVWRNGTEVVIAGAGSPDAEKQLALVAVGRLA